MKVYDVADLEQNLAEQGWTVTGVHGGTGLRACCGRLFGRFACPTGRGGGNSDRT